MLRVERILFPTDFSPLAEAALTYALAVAEKHGATLHVMHAIVLHADDPHDPAHHFPDAEEIRQRLEELADRRMAGSIAERGPAQVDVVRVQRRGISAAPAILDYAAEIDADLIVMSTHGRRGLGHVFLGSVTEEVVRLSRCPVLTVRGPPDATDIQRIERVLVPVDYSEHAVHAISYGREICAAYGARLHALHVYEPPVYSEFYLGDLPTNLPGFSAVEQSLREELERVVRQAKGPDVEATLHLRDGRAAGEIVGFAEELEISLIVIATHGLTGLSHVLMGSIAEKVVRRAASPVLTVKSFGKSLLE